MKSSIQIFAVIVLLVLHGADVHAGVKRALIIGIDTYEQTPQTPAAFAQRGDTERSGWKNLNGCVNDAQSMRNLITARYGFQQQNIDTLYNKQATHESILNALNTLISDCQAPIGGAPGDVVLIYYAGHGSQVKNSRSYDGSGQDQTMVPSDLWDIRNKELAPLFNQLLDKGVTLTLIFDCCHSGALARGNSLPVEYVSRQAPPLDFDFADPSEESKKPEERGALVFSAAQRDQTAKEATDENGIAHGAFTLALLHAINSSSTNESSSQIFTRVVANLKSDGGPKFQDPIMGANETRRNATLFGIPVTEGSARTVVGVQEVKGGYVYLRGGFELSIYPGCRFAKVGGKDTLEVISVGGIGACIAKVTMGNINEFHPGDLVEMLNWVTPDKATLLIWKPECAMSSVQLKVAIAPVNSLFTSGYCTKVLDQTTTAPQYVIQYHAGQWMISQAGNPKIKKLTELTDKNLTKEITKGSNVCLQLPPTKELSDSLLKRLGKGSDNSAIEFTSDPLAANYILAGRSNGRMEYALIRPNASSTDTGMAPSLPMRTKWIGADPAGKSSDSIADYAVRLGKLNAWINLSSPPDEFPYYLGLKHAGGALLKSGETVYGGERLELVLLLDTTRFTPYHSKRFINVFAIDANGQMTLLYPRPELGDGNQVEYKGKYQSKRMVPLEKKQGVPLGFNIGEPYGTDTYFMVASETPLPSDIFMSDGVMERGPAKAGSNGLTNMMRNYGTRTRAPQPDPVESLWSVQKIVVKSAAKK